MVYSPSWPANTPTSGQVKRTTAIPANYQVSHLYGVASMHPWWSSCSASWGQYRTSGCLLFLDQDHCTNPQTVWLLDGTNIQHFLDMGPHIIIPVRRHMSLCLLRGIWSVTSNLCFIRAVLPRSRSLWANRCSHLSSSSLDFSCSGLGHSLRLWRSRASKTHPFGDCYWIPWKPLLGGPPVALGWQGLLVQPQYLQGFLWNGCLSCTDRLVPSRTLNVVLHRSPSVLLL